MTQIDSTSIYLLVIFILPGFLSYLVYKSLYRKGTGDKDIEVTYKSLLHSALIYAILYIIFEALGYSMLEFFIQHPNYALIIMLLASNILGIIIFKFTEKDYLYKFLSKTHFLTGRAQPPNLYAALLDPKFQPKAIDGCWILFEKNGVTHEAYAKYTDVVGDERLVYVTEVKQIDSEGNVLVEHPPSFGMVLDLTKLDWLEIVYGD